MEPKQRDFYHNITKIGPEDSSDSLEKEVIDFNEREKVKLDKRIAKWQKIE
jgi:hypothetical protein